jgi:hypothetical protein
MSYGIGMSQDIPNSQKSCPKCKSTNLVKIKFGFSVDNWSNPMEKLNAYFWKCQVCKLVSLYDESY